MALSTLRMPAVPRSFALATAFSLICALLAPVPSHAQTPADLLIARCDDASGVTDLSLECADAGLALHAMVAGVGLLGSAGGPIPASPSTAGLRIGSTPRFIFDLGLTGASFSHPDLAASRNAGGIPEKRSTLTGGRAAVVAGLFNGFSPFPSIGGFLSVDAVAGASLLRLPDGSSGGSFLGAGARVGLMRESFTLPGVTLSGMHYRGSDIRYGNLAESGSAVEFSPNTTSLRLTVGKDLLPVGISGGIGRDRYRGKGSISAFSPVGGPPPGGVEVSTEAVELAVDRSYLFLGATYTFIVFQIGGEVVWSRSASNAPEAVGSSPFRPGGREFQGALSFRLTY